mmetsp:Transcript_2649/g.6091  ORF Transcript_2649/g.6091 Transcript_2649/m.6091 type:complete len:225 (+) Transcript_2649:88-762(+)
MESYNLLNVTPLSQRRRRSNLLVVTAAVCVVALLCVSTGFGSNVLSLASPGRMSMRTSARNSIRTRAAIGDSAPTFKLPSESGKQISLEDFKGPFGIEALSKPVVVFFYGGQGSPSCTKEAEAFRDAYPEIKASGAEVLGISRDSNEFSQQWKSEKGLPFPLLSDEDGSIREAFGIKKDLFGLLDGRETYVIGKDGKIQMKFNSQFEPEKHVDKVLDTLSGMAA